MSQQPQMSVQNPSDSEATVGRRVLKLDTDTVKNVHGLVMLITTTRYEIHNISYCHQLYLTKILQLNIFTIT